MILTIASCLSIFLGEEDTLAGQFPRDLYGAAFLKTGEENPETRIQNLTEKHAEEYGLTIERPHRASGVVHAACGIGWGVFLPSGWGGTRRKEPHCNLYDRRVLSADDWRDLIPG